MRYKKKRPLGFFGKFFKSPALCLQVRKGLGSEMWSLHSFTALSCQSLEVDYTPTPDTHRYTHAPSSANRFCDHFYFKKSFGGHCCICVGWSQKGVFLYTSAQAVFIQTMAPDTITLTTLCLAAKVAISHFKEWSKYFHYDHVIVYYGMAKLLNLAKSSVKKKKKIILRNNLSKVKHRMHKAVWSHYFSVNLVSNKSLNTTWIQDYTERWMKILR